MKLFFFSGERFEAFLVSFMAGWVSIGRTRKVKRKIQMVNLTSLICKLKLLDRWQNFKRST